MNSGNSPRLVFVLACVLGGATFAQPTTMSLQERMTLIDQQVATPAQPQAVASPVAASASPQLVQQPPRPQPQSQSQPQTASPTLPLLAAEPASVAPAVPVAASTTPTAWAQPLTSTPSLPPAKASGGAMPSIETTVVLLCLAMLGGTALWFFRRKLRLPRGLGVGSDGIEIRQRRRLSPQAEIMVVVVGAKAYVIASGSNGVQLLGGYEPAEEAVATVPPVTRPRRPQPAMPQQSVASTSADTKPFDRLLATLANSQQQGRAAQTARQAVRKPGATAAAKAGGWVALLVMACLPAMAWAQPVAPQATPVQPMTSTTSAANPTYQQFDIANPATMVELAGRAIDRQSVGSLEDTASPEVKDDQLGVSTTLSILALLTLLALAPAILIMCTSFTRILIVLSLLRQAMGTQSLPPNQLLIGIALVLTLLVMSPTLEVLNTNALQPWSQGEIGPDEAWVRVKQPMRAFMLDQIAEADHWNTVYMILNYRGVDTSDPSSLKLEELDMLTVIPAYVLSELKVAFRIGFQLYLPFLIIDMVVASVLISMGMLMLPPVLISLPFKLLLFVLTDGWVLVAGNLLNSFAT